MTSSPPSRGCGRTWSSAPPKAPPPPDPLQRPVQLSLSFKTGGPLTHADVALTNAVNNYVAAQTPATAKALQDQIDVAEQLFVGQYWGSDALESFLDSL